LGEENVKSENQAFIDCFRRLYNAHETIAGIEERMKKLYDSALTANSFITGDGSPKHRQNPKRLEKIMVELADLESYTDELLKQRAAFDVFLSRLSTKEQQLLSLKCEKDKGWKEVAFVLKTSVDSCQRAFLKICEEAQMKGLI
jgi:hypothetical protein